MALFDFDVTTCKTTNKCQKEGLFTTSVPVDPKFWRPNKKLFGEIKNVTTNAGKNIFKP